MLVIADAERAQAIGGVMGGAESEVSSGTTRDRVRSAWFKPQSVRATSKRLGLRTEASNRFERGADLTAPGRAMARACELLEQIGAGTRAAPIVDVYPKTPRQPQVHARARAGSPALLGMDVPDADVERILTSLGFERGAAATAGAPRAGRRRRSPPAWRVDIQRPVDLIEEVGRHHGFEHLPTTFPAVEQAPPPSDPRIARDAASAGRARHGLQRGDHVRVHRSRGGGAVPAGGAPVALANPLSEKFTVLRPSLLPGLVDAVSHNRRHGRRDVRLFEIGTRFSPTGETRGAALAWTAWPPPSTGAAGGATSTSSTSRASPSSWRRCVAVAADVHRGHAPLIWSRAAPPTSS